MAVSGRGSAEEQTRQQHELFVLLGKTSITWQQLESSLCGVFTAISRMDRTLARRIFYSARSFQGRTDMLKAAVSCPTVQFSDPTEGEFVKKCIERAGQYASVRNIIAHDSIVFFAFDGHEHSGKHVIIDGKYDRFLGGEDALTVEQLSRFHQNVSHLFLLLQLFLQRQPATNSQRGKQLLSLLHKLPKAPRVSTLGAADAALLLSLVPDPFQIRL
jgi:hypothetical protein